MNEDKEDKKENGGQTENIDRAYKQNDDLTENNNVSNNSNIPNNSNYLNNSINNEFFQNNSDFGAYGNGNFNVDNISRIPYDENLFEKKKGKKRTKRFL